MKKILLLFTLAITILLSACSKPNQNLTIKPSQFSKETWDVLGILNDEIIFLDYTIDETVQSFSLDCWLYKNGEWITSTSTYGNIDNKDNRLALRLTENSYDLFFIDEESYSKHSSPNIDIDFSNSRSVTSIRIQSTTPIHLNEEIPLWVKLGTDKNSLKSAEAMLEDFRDAECDSGIAITLTFSDKSVE